MRVSEHFLQREFACRHCGQVRIVPELVERLEHLRRIVGEPLVVVSGYRCATHNTAIGGAARSRHLLGEAVDLRHGYARVSQAAHAGFLGIGRRGGWAVHVDVREKPARWSYGD
jgi:uncharacterized protein YcbK (DUF882 family)